MSGSADPVSIKQEPETVVTEHSQTPDTDRLTLTERDKTKDATESSTFLKTQTAAEVGLDTERDIKQERSWNETISLQADHDDAACTTEACSDTNSFSDKTCNIHLEADVKQSLTESSTARHDMESTESADMMSQYRKCQGVHTVGTEQVIHIKQEIDDTDFYSATGAQTESSTRSNQPGTLMGSSSPSQLTHCTTESIQETRKVQTRRTVKGEPVTMHLEQICQGLGPCKTSRSPGDARSNDTHTGSIPVKTEPQEPTSFTATPPVVMPVVDSVSDMDAELEDKPKQSVFPVGLYRNFHASDCKPETSVAGRSGETTSKGCDAGRPDTGECEMHQQHTGQDEKSGFSTDYPCIKQLLNLSAQTPRGMDSQTCGQLPIITASDSKTNESLFLCKECETAFSSSSDLNNHMKVHTENRPYVCKQCGSAFKSTGLLKKHMKTHTEDRPYECKQCGSAFKSKDLVNKHMKVHTENRPYVCKQCGRAFKSTGLLNRHMKTHAENRPHVCKRCGAAFKCSGILNRHMMIHTGNKPYACDQCGAAFSQSHHLKEHIMTHTGDKPFRCKECGATFSRAFTLKQHMTIHTGDKSFVCKQCGAAFSRGCILNKHMRVHTGERPHVCKECGAAFSQSSHLREHVVTHSDDKPYKCEQCGAAYGWHKSFKRHMMTHTSEKPYVCKECGTAFCEFKDLKHHMKIHTVQKPFVCGKCWKAFTQPGKLDRHMMTHSGEKPHVCKQCGAAFNKLGSLKQHMSTHTDKCADNVMQLPSVQAECEPC